MKTDEELEYIADTIRTGYQLRSERIGAHVKLLRSIEIAALREAREIVEKRGDDDLGHAGCIDDMEKLIRQLELK